MLLYVICDFTESVQKILQLLCFTDDVNRGMVLTCRGTSQYTFPKPVVIKGT